MKRERERRDKREEEGAAPAASHASCFLSFSDGLLHVVPNIISPSELLRSPLDSFDAIQQHHFAPEHFSSCPFKKKMTEYSRRTRSR